MAKKYSRWQRWISGCLLAVFLFAITPHQFVHDILEQHHDTIDFYHHDTEVSSVHIHCDYLHVLHAPFSLTKEALFNKISFQFISFQSNPVAFYPAGAFFHFYLRGPPSCKLI